MAGAVQVLGRANAAARAAHAAAARPQGQREPTPRPVGVSTRIPYEPRVPYRQKQKSDFVRRAVEFFEEHPQYPNLLRVALHVWWRLVHGDRPAPPPDIRPEDGAWKFSVIGDYGAGTDVQAQVAANILAGKPELLLTTGDNVYPSGRFEDYRRNFSPDRFMGKIMRSIPVMPALGNHDLYRDDLVPYFAHFPHLKGLPYYTFTHRNAQFFALDTDQDLSPGSAQYRWLEQELARSTARWKVIYLHYPPVSTEPDGGDVQLRNWLAPLLARYGIKLVLAGHEHSYQRSHAIDGVHYVITGGGGQIVYAFRAAKQPFIATRAPLNHHVEVFVGDNSLVVRAIDNEGRIIDAFEIPNTPGAQARDGAAQLQPAA